MTTHEKAISLSKDFKGRSLNEADTRHQIIDPIIHDVLSWPRNRVSCEEYIAPGYADYVLRRADNAPILFIEAKKEGDYFQLPVAFTGQSLGSYLKVKKLLTDDSIRKAITQVRTYCLDIGCDVGAITNGHEWIFFKTFQKEEDWKNLNAFVISSLDYFAERFIEAHNYFSFVAIIEKGSLRRLLLDSTIHNRELFYPKLKVASFDAPVDANHYASTLRPIADNYFGVIDVEDFEFMEYCYVSDREYDLAFANARRRLEDAITPYLEQYNVQNFKDSTDGGGFGKRLTKNIINTKSADVVVLFGGKGVGKSTFLRKLLFHKPPQIIKKNSVVALIDLLNTPPEKDLVRSTIWDSLIKCLDLDAIMSSDREKLCMLFQDRFEQAKRQDLFGLDETSESYNIKLNELIREWKNDQPYVASKLAAYWRARHKIVIVIVDNTDQYKEELQELCFSVSLEMSALLSCLVVISMREEKFHSSSIHGVLDAYQNSGFHITSPEPRQVFLRRIGYVQKLLRTSNDEVGSALPANTDRDVISKLFQVFRNEFDTGSSHLANFLAACSHGNIRLALELFRGFLVSGYTNVNEITSIHGWTLQIHQVIKPFMIPNRFFYEESKSKIPNVFQIRSKSNGSHFTALRILSKLSVGQDSKNPPFMPVAKLASDFVDIFGMKEDFDQNMSMLLTHALIESNNRVEDFDGRVDSVKITVYGEFLLNMLCKAFTYFELVCTDCAISDQLTSNTIAALACDDYSLYLKYERMERIKKRIEKADVFLKYLEREEQRERDIFRTHDFPNFTTSIRSAFEIERLRVLKSAKRNT
jgi:GTPase SAR1 family protein